MSRLIVASVIGGGILAGILLARRSSSKYEFTDQRISPDFGVHRGVTAATGQPPSVRMPSWQDPRGGMVDLTSYPYSRSEPSALAKGEPNHKDPYQAQPQGYSKLDYGPPPMRIARLNRDSNRYWDGLEQRGMSQQNQQVHLFHLRPSPPTRGYRSVSHVLTGAGPTASRVRVPAVFVPSSVS